MENPKIVGLVSLLSLCTLAMWAALALDYIAPWTESVFPGVAMLVFGYMLSSIFTKPHTESEVLGSSIVAFGFVHAAHHFTFDLDKPPVDDWFSFEIPYVTEFLIVVAAIFSFGSMIGAWGRILFPDKPEEEEPKPKKSPKPQKSPKRR